MGGSGAATVARAAAIPPQTMDRYLKGTMPSADRALALADALGADPRWLISGVGERSPVGLGYEADSVALPKLDLMAFSEEGKPEPQESMGVKREWLGRWPAAGLWVAEMPSDSVPEIAREGDLLVCQDPVGPPVDGRAYAFLLDGRLLIRRVQIRKDGLALKTSRDDRDPLVIPPDQAENLIPIARILAAISLQPV